MLALSRHRAIEPPSRQSIEPASSHSIEPASSFQHRASRPGLSSTHRRPLCQTVHAHLHRCVSMPAHCDPRYRYLRDQYLTAGGTYCVIGSTADAVHGPVSASRVLSLRLCIAPRVPRPCTRKSLDG